MKKRVAIPFALFLLLSPAVAQEREWSFDSSEDEAFMIFGVPESDDVGVSFWCTLRSGEIRLFLPQASEKLKANEPAKFEVSVGGQSFILTGMGLPNEEAGTMSIEGRLPAGDRLFKALQDADRFSVTVSGEKQTFPLTGADLPSLLAACSAE
jgi:hypothetical protein